MAVTLGASWIPHGEFRRFERFLPRLYAIYESIVIVLPPEVDADILDALEAMDAVLVYQMSRLGEGRHLALKYGLGTAATHLQYCDMDRLIRWVETQPDELEATQAVIQASDYVLIGRTKAAFATHPQALQKTETIIHGVFSHFLGAADDYDFCAGSKGLSRRAAEYVVAHDDPYNGLGSDVTWALLVQQAGFSITSHLVDGLDWETADRHQDQAAGPNLQQRKAAEYDAKPESWVMRTDLAWNIIRAGLEVLEREK